MRIHIMLLPLLLFSIAGCAHVMGDDIRTLEVSRASYEKLRDKPQDYLGKSVELGGVIIDVTNSVEGGDVEVIQYPLTDEGFPDELQGSAGRFLITSPTPFDSTVYQKGLPITVIGEVKGARHLKSQPATAPLPVVSLRKAHIWRAEEERKMPFVVPGTNLVDPYYYGYDTPLPKRPLGIKTDLW